MGQKSLVLSAYLPTEFCAVVAFVTWLVSAPHEPPSHHQGHQDDEQCANDTEEIAH
jgi:hypothetical protein